MPQLFELLFPLLWLGLGVALWRHDRWQATLFAAFYAFCLFCEALAIRFGEYFYGPLLVAICPPGPMLRAGLAVGQHSLCLPLAVPCMEGLFFFAGWTWAARRETNRALRPLFGALVAVIADLAFDPVAAQGIEPGGGGRAWPGIGLWTWILDPADPGSYFGIPVDNPLAWLATCCGFGYAALLWPRWRKKDPRRLGFWGRAKLAAQVSLLGLALAALLFALLDLVVTPPGTGQAYRVTALFTLLGGLFAWAAWRAWRQPPGLGGDPTADAIAGAALAASLGYALLALLLGEDDAGLLPLCLLVATALAGYWAAPFRAGQAGAQATPTLLAASSRTPRSIRRTISGRPASETEQIASRR